MYGDAVPRRSIVRIVVAHRLDEADIIDVARWVNPAACDGLTLRQAVDTAAIGCVRLSQVEMRRASLESLIAALLHQRPEIEMLTVGDGPAVKPALGPVAALCILLPDLSVSRLQEPVQLGGLPLIRPSWADGTTQMSSLENAVDIPFALLCDHGRSDAATLHVLAQSASRQADGPLPSNWVSLLCGGCLGTLSLSGLVDDLWYRTGRMPKFGA